MAESQRDETLQQKPCPICGGETFRWGNVSMGTAHSPLFNEDAKSQGFFDQPRLVKLAARECSRCGNVQWFTQA